jgi:transposase InsO family protein
MKQPGAVDRTDHGRPPKLMIVLDEWSRECLTIHVARRIRATDVLEVFADLMQVHAVPTHIRSDNGPEMIAATLRECRPGARRGRGRAPVRPDDVRPDPLLRPNRARCRLVLGLQ